MMVWRKTPMGLENRVHISLYIRLFRRDVGIHGVVSACGGSWVRRSRATTRRTANDKHSPFHATCTPT